MNKICKNKKCTTEASLQVFNKNKTKKDGLSIYCRNCDRARIRAIGQKQTRINRVKRMHLTEASFADLKKRAANIAYKLGAPEIADDIICEYVDKISKYNVANLRWIACDLIRDRLGDKEDKSNATRKELERGIMYGSDREEHYLGIIDKKERSELDLLKSILPYKEGIDERKWIMFALYAVFNLTQDIIGELYGIGGTSVNHHVKEVGLHIRKKGFELA